MMQLKIILQFNCSVHADFSFVIPPHSEVVAPVRLDIVPENAAACGIVIARSACFT